MKSIIFTIIFTIFSINSYADDVIAYALERTHTDVKLALLYGHHVWIIQDEQTFAITHEDIDCKKCLDNFIDKNYDIEIPDLIIDKNDRYEIEDITINNHNYWRIIDKKTNQVTIVHNYIKCIECNRYFD